jgi:GNAT superfamily N-acetyltransferase
MPLELRRASIDDTPPLVRLMLELGYDVDEAAMRRRLGRLLGLGDHAVFVASEPPYGIVGALHVAVSVTLILRPFADIRALIVRRDHRRQGVGQALVERCLRWATDRGVLDVVTTAQAHRQAAAGFYRSLGFRLLGEHNVFIRTLDAPHAHDEPTAMD